MAQPLLDNLLIDWRALLSLWSNTGSLTRAAQDALLLEDIPARLQQVVAGWRDGSFQDLPPVVVLPASAMPAAMGAYATRTGTIYLNGDWLSRASRAAVLAVLTEELGHHLDALLNGTDTPGDEGELFAALLIGGGSISEAQRMALLAENDHWSLQVAGQELAVEMAARLVSTPIAASAPGRTQREWRNRGGFAALRANGSVVSWGSGTAYAEQSSAVAAQLASGVTQIFSSLDSFAALKTDGSVITWGYAGGDSSAVANQLRSGVIEICSTETAFAAIKSDGSVVTWGHYAYGGDSRAVAAQLASGVIQISSNQAAFAALKADGSVVTWGHPSLGGGTGGYQYDQSPGARLTSGVVRIFSAYQSFAALKSDGSVVTWGASGGDSRAVAVELSSGVTQIFSTDTSYAALKSGGSVITWGFGGSGGDSSSVASLLSSGVSQIVSTATAFAALKSDGSVVTWGNPYQGGDSSSVANKLSSGVAQIFATSTAFAALKSDGSVVTWPPPNPYGGSGGDSSAVAIELRSGVSKIFSTSHGFAALKSNGSVVTWGGSGAVSDSVAVKLRSGVIQIFSAEYAFAALKGDGSVVSWGDPAAGGDSSSVASQLTGVVAFANPFTDDRWILSPEPPTITLTVYPASVAEDDSSNLIFIFTRTGPIDTGLTVNYTVDGTAILSTDYTGTAATPAAKTVSFAAGSATATITVDPTADTTIEPNETVELTLAAGTGYSIGTTAAVVGTILNDDFPVVTLAASPSAGVTEDGTSNLVYAFSRTGSTSSPLTVSLSLGGSASASSGDYANPSGFTLSSGFVTFAAGSSTATLTIDPSSDAEVEADETVIISLNPGIGYAIGAPATATGTILNDDSQIEAKGNAFLNRRSDGQAVVLQGTTSFNVSSPWGANTGDANSDWLMLAAESIGGNNQILWRYKPTNQIHTWTLSPNWAWQSSSPLINRASPETWAIESGFQIDLNGDSIIGTP